MFSSLGFFSKIPCPNDGNCLLPNCLFLHGTPARPATRTASATATSGDTSHHEPSTPDGSLPRKRQKLESGSVDCGKPTAFGDSQSKPLKEQTGPGSVHLTTRQPGVAQWKGSEDKTVLQSVKRPISPPLSHRQTVHTSQTQDKGRGGATSTLSSRKDQLPPVHRRGPAEETLNPRLLPAAPASHSFRLTVVTKLHEQFVRLNKEIAKEVDASSASCSLSEQDLIKMALDEEEDVALGNRLVYSNIIKNRLMWFTKMKVKDWKELLWKKKSQESAPAAALEATGPTAPPPIETGLSQQGELAVLRTLQANPRVGLSQFGYITTVPTAAELEDAKKGLETACGWEVCDRCKTRFQVFPGRRDDGALTTGGKCSYHWGKPYAPPKNPGERSTKEKRYACCNEPLGTSAGCTKADCHVFKAGEVKRMALVLQFKETPANPDVPSNRALCLDCEMCYTVYGLELVRLTATAWPGREEVLDVLVRPMGEILDLNSRFSGILPQQLANAKPYDERSEKPSSEESSGLRIVSSPSAARELLLRHIRPDTPLIGHALENDLAATRIIHLSIIDSALLFPHRFGLPYRNSLKMLMRKHLQRDIQMTSDNQVGHDSKEDARAAGDLIRWAVGNEWKKLKREGWKMEGEGNLVPPWSVAAPKSTSDDDKNDGPDHKERDVPDEGKVGSKTS